MKKSVYLLPFGFAAAYAVLLSLGMACALHLLGVALAMSLDGNVLAQYPRFVPFCLAGGSLALTAGIGLLVLRGYATVRVEVLKKTRLLEGILGAVAAVPLVAVWEMLFALLRNAL